MFICIEYESKNTTKGYPNTIQNAISLMAQVNQQIGTKGTNLLDLFKMVKIMVVPLQD